MKIVRRILDWLKTDDPNLQMHKGGHNDLSRWKAFGGTLERPAPPAPMIRTHSTNQATEGEKVA